MIFHKNPNLIFFNLAFLIGDQLQVRINLSINVNNEFFYNLLVFVFKKPIYRLRYNLR